MNKKLIIPIICISIIIIGIIGFILWNNRTVSTIILDINPSVKISLKKDGKVKKVEALNDDAKEIISDDLKGKTLDDTLDVITKNVVEKGFVEEDQVTVIVHTEGKTNNEEVKTKLSEKFNGNQIHAEIIEVEKVTKEDEKLAKKYGISPSKASYINSVDNVPVENLVDKEVSDIKETKETGYYCDAGYNLEGGNCVKELGRKPALNGTICPNGFVDEDGICYEEVAVEETGNLICRDEFTLEGNECIRKRTVDAVVTSYTCPQGEVRTKAEVGDAPYNSGPANDPVCIDPSKITHPVTPCGLPASDPTERMSAGGRCYWHRAPVIAEGCPGKIQVNGFCWDDATNVYLCPNSKNSNTRSKDDNCYVVLNVKPIPDGYKCDEEDMKLEGTKCIKEEKEPAESEHICKTGYTLVNNSRCMNYKKTVEKFSGYYCEDQRATLVDDTCVLIERIEAKHN